MAKVVLMLTYVGVAGPGQVLVAADDGEDLHIGVGKGDDGGVCAGLEACGAVVRNGDILSDDGGGYAGEECSER